MVGQSEEQTKKTHGHDLASQPHLSECFIEEILEDT